MATAAILGGIALGSGVLAASESLEAAHAREAALNQRLKQIQAQTRQNQINNMDRVNHMMATQTAIAAANGGALSGPSSLNTIQMDTLNEFAKDENAEALNLSFQTQAIDQAKQNAQAAGWIGAGQGIFKAAIGAVGAIPVGGAAAAAQAGSAVGSSASSAANQAVNSSIPEI